MASAHSFLGQAVFRLIELRNAVLLEVTHVAGLAVIMKSLAAPQSDWTIFLTATLCVLSISRLTWSAADTRSIWAVYPNIETVVMTAAIRKQRRKFISLFLQTVANFGRRANAP